MQIIIDGYNLIRQSDDLRRMERLSLEEGRRALIRRAGLYQRTKGHRMTIVFDGWESGSPMEERDRQEGVDIIYSRQGEKADEVIKRIAQQGNDDLIVVTSDRGIADFVTRRGKTVISSPEFEAKLNSPSASPYPHQTDDDDTDKQAQKKKGPSHRLPKSRKNALAKFKKL